MFTIKALGNIDRDRLGKVKLLVIGDGPERNSLAELSDSLLPDQTVFTGEITNVSDLLQISDIYVQFSNTEGLSRSIIEALSYKLPCIVSDVGGNGELIRDAYNGSLIEADDTDRLTGSLDELICNKSLREEQGERSSRHFEENFDFSQYQNNYLNLYQP